MIADIDNKKKNASDGRMDNKEKKSEDSFLSRKAVALKVSYLSEIPKIIKKSDLNIISEDSARKHQVVVFEKKGNKTKVAMVDPQDIEALNALRFVKEKDGLEMEIYLVSFKNFQNIVAKYSTAEKAVEEALKSLSDEGTEGVSFEIRKEDEERKNREIIQDAPIAKLVQVIIKHALDGRASDIHIEPIDDNYRVRFRVDGILYSSLIFPKNVGMAVVSRIKILSSLKIDEKRKPQDGRFQVNENGIEIDFRVSSLPVLEGEKIAMRILDKDNQLLDLSSLGLIGRNYEILIKKIKDPYGIILVAGPTGSGKSTTLYAFLQILNQEERNIITLEDPIEYNIRGVNQSQIKPEIGYTFANGLRSILRQDPNVIMVGEIRDNETAELAIHAALTGHLVFSTVHTNDSIGTIPRLIDMGIEPFLISSSLRAVAAQRLVRKICEKCKEKIEMPYVITEQIKNEIDLIHPDELKKYGLNSSEKIEFYQGRGCSECGGLGYKGRVAIFEALEIDGILQEIISEKKDSEQNIRKEAKNKGMLTMRQDGIVKIIKGLTTLAEVERVTEGSLSVGGDLDDDKG